MALPATTVWEIRTDGNADNGGGFNAARAGTDYSQQAAAQLSLTDLACASNTTLTSATGGFTAAMVGNLVRIASGTNDVPGWYEITAYTNTNTVTIDRTCATGGNMTDGVGNVGGALDGIGTLGSALSVADQSVAGMKAYVRGGTYNLSNTTVNTTGGPLDLDASQQDSKSFYLKGYATDAANRDAWTGTRPVIDCNDQAPTNVIKLKGASSEPHVVAFVDVIGDAGTPRNISPFLGVAAYYDFAISCIGRNCSGGSVFAALVCINCHAKDNGNTTTGFSNTAAWGCLASSGGKGFDIGLSVPVINCMAANCALDGFEINGSIAINCTSYNCTGDGFDEDTDRSSVFINCLSYSDGGYSFNTSVESMLYNCASDGASSGRTPAATPPRWDLGAVTITGDPFTDAANLVFALDDTTAEGKACRGVGASGYGQTGYLDIGAVQHADPAGGGGLLAHAGMNGGMNG